MANYLVFTGSENRGNWATYAYVDNMNSSINQQFITLKYYTDSSLLQRDTSINQIASLMGSGYNNLNASIGIALQPFATNVSVNNTFAKYIKSASIGTGLYWVNNKLDVSINAGVTTLFDLHDVSIANTVMGSRDGRILTYDESDFVWRDGSALGEYGFITASAVTTNAIDILNYFYTKIQIDDLLDQVVGGTYT